MMMLMNDLGQPIGESLEDRPQALLPTYTAFEGRLSRIEPIDEKRHAKDLFEAYANDIDDSMWT